MPDPYTPAVTLNPSLVRGYAQIYNLVVQTTAGVAATTLTSSNTLSASLLSGDDVPASATPTAAWTTASSGQYTVSFIPSDTSSLAPGTYTLYVTASISGNAVPVGIFRVILLDSPGTSTGNAIDLVTMPVVQAALATVLPADQSYIAQAITAASQAVCQYLGNQAVKYATYDQILTPTISGFILPLQQPVNQVTRVMSGRQTVMTVQLNNTNVQVATVYYAITGDWDTGQTVTGLTLTWMENGTTTTQTINWSSLTPATVASLAAAINAIGSGWLATVAGGYGGWAVSELITQDVASQDGLQGAWLEVFSQNLTGSRISTTGRVIDMRWACPTQGGGTTFPWGFLGGGGYGGTGPSGGDTLRWPQCRVIYTAGWLVVPQAIQQAVIETLKAFFERLKTDTTLKGEHADGYSYEALGSETVMAIPKSARQLLATYRVRFLGSPGA